jgi:phenylacetate-CoA ligase
LGLEPSSFPEKAALVRESVKRKILVTPEVEIVPYGSLPRSERKTKRIIDMRQE